MPEITCAVVEDLLDAYIAGETSERTNRVLAEHINECAACQAALVRRRRSREAMTGSYGPAAPDAARQVVGRARRRLYAGIAVVLILAVAVVSVGLDRLYAYRVPAPMRVAGVEEYAVAVVPGWEMARTLGAVQDVHHEVNDWLTIDSVLFGSDGTYVLYTTTNRTKVQFTAHGPFSMDRGAVSPVGFHGLVTLPPVPTSFQSSGAGSGGITEVPLRPLELDLAVTGAWRVVNVLGVWLATETPTDATAAVSLTFDPAEAFVEGRIYHPGTVIELMGGTITVSEVRVGFPTVKVVLEVDMPEGTNIDGMTLRLQSEDPADMVDWVASGSVVSMKENGRRVLLFGPAFSKLPGNLALHIDKVHVAESGHTDIRVPWAEYAGRTGQEIEAWPAGELPARRTIVRLPDTAAFRLPTIHGALQVVGIDPVSRAVVMEFHSADGEPIPGEVWPLAPYTFGANTLLSANGMPWSGNLSTQMWENEGRHYYVIEIPARFAEENDSFLLRFEKRGQDVRVDKSWIVKLGDA